MIIYGSYLYVMAVVFMAVGTFLVLSAFPRKYLIPLVLVTGIVSEFAGIMLYVLREETDNEKYLRIPEWTVYTAGIIAFLVALVLFFTFVYEATGLGKQNPGNFKVAIASLLVFVILSLSGIELFAKNIYTEGSITAYNPEDEQLFEYSGWYKLDTSGQTITYMDDNGAWKTFSYNSSIVEDELKETEE